MLFEQVAILGIIFVILILFVWGRWRYDIVALMALSALAMFGLIPVNELFYGFGHPATITVAIVLVLSYGLTKSGAVEYVGRIVAPISTPSLHIAALIFITAFFSLGASGLIVTEEKVWMNLAHSIGEDFLIAYLNRRASAGQILLKLRKELLDNHNNPFGFLYSYYGTSTITYH